MTEPSTLPDSVALIAQATFGRDSAMFEGLLGFVAQLSVGLWGLVILTVVMRFVGVGMYRRGARRRAARATLAETVAPIAAVPTIAVPTTAVPTTTAVIDLVQPAAVQLTAAFQLTGSVTNATFDEVLRPAAAPAAVASSMPVQRNWRSEPRSAGQLPALASNATEA
jgi:hypothetical protein